MKIGIASDHGGFEIYQELKDKLTELGHTVVDFGNTINNPDDDYPDYIMPLAKAVAGRNVERGIAICGSGVGVCIAANKVSGARAALVHDLSSAKQGVEEDDMNVLCLGGRIIDIEKAMNLSLTFLEAQFTNGERFKRRLLKIDKMQTMLLDE